MNLDSSELPNHNGSTLLSLVSSLMVALCERELFRVHPVMAYRAASFLNLIMFVVLSRFGLKFHIR